jgi:hypothetical protein
MVVAKRKPDPAPDLAGVIMQLRGEVESFLDGKIAQIKASRDGKDLPVEVIRQSLTRSDSCLCRVAMNILATSD